MSSNGSILGFNSSSAICMTKDSVLVGVGGGVVVRRGGDSRQWVPGDGRYLIDKLAYSSFSHLLCVTEKRLSVVLHVFKYPEFNCVQKVEDVASVEIQDMLFSPNGQMLAVLTCMGSSSVTLFSVQRGRTLEKRATVNLDDKFWKRLVFPPHRVDSVAVLESQEVALVSQLLLVSSLPNVVSLSSRENKFYSFCWCACGLLCGVEKGEIILFDELTMEMQNYLNCPTDSAVTSLLYANGLLLIGAEDGMVFGYNLEEKELRPLHRIGNSVKRILFSGNGSSVLFVSKGDITTFDISSAESAVVRERSLSPTVQILTIGARVVWVSADGSLMRYDKTTNTVFYLTVDFDEKAMDACSMGSVVVVIYDNGCVRCFAVDDEFTFSSHTKLGDGPLCICASDGVSSLAVSDGTTIYFVTLRDGVLCCHGFVDVLTARVTGLRWVVSGDPMILTTLSNGEVQLLRCFYAGGTQAGPLAVEIVWRLDYPAQDFLPLYVDDDVINILVHSLDKDTKLYVLERRRERDIKPLRPLFLMRDHEGGAGIVLQRLGEKAVLSGGTDGKVVVRDISHYLVKLTPIPPSKEKRRPQNEYFLRPLGKSGITLLCAWDDDSGFVCGGDDTIVHLIPSGGPVHGLWTEPVWREEKHLSLVDSVKSAVEMGDVMAEQSKSHVLSALAELRVAIDGLLEERGSAVRVEDFLLPSQQELFSAECELAIHKAKEDDYYRLLHNEFTQHIIRRECWDTMEVPRSKIVSLNDPTLVVYNFHRCKTRPEKSKLLKKIKFLRMVQMKDGHCFTFSSVVKRPGSHRLLMQQEREASDDILELLYDPMDMYTNSRAIIQMFLLSERISQVKMAFNIRFDSLSERKKRELRRIEERNDRCQRIMRQLGEPSLSPDVLFTPVFDVEEDPKTVFEVFDSEIDSELLKLAKKTDDTAFVISPSDEAALKTWMDGLEKDAEVLAVKVTLPAFADESLEQYVAPDERSKEQQKVYEEYEKQLAEQTAYVMERKKALHEEMRELMKANEAATKKINEEIVVLRKQRMDVFESVDEMECHQVNALRRLFLPTTIRNELLGVMQEKTELQGRLRQLQSLETYRQKLLTTGETKLKQATDKEKGLVAQMRLSPPFDDSCWGDKLYRRFTRWCAKYEEGLVKLPLVEQPDTVPVSLWELYCDCCSTIVKAKDVVASNASSVRALTEDLVMVEGELEKVQKDIAEKEAVEASCKESIICRILDVQNLYRLRQGQVQDENAKLNTDFISFSFRRVKDVLDYNALIFSSFDEIAKLMGKISQKRQAMKMSSWETERLQYSVGTLEMQLRQLHTLRVTRQMQESIYTGAMASHETEVEKLNQRIDHVRQAMSRKVEERNRVIARLNMQINDRNMENAYLDEQVQRTKSVVEDKKAVWGMLGEHNNEETRLQERMRELHENSELEELARCQQEELVRLKREVDCLRERTFPSFAVVSKKTVR